MLVEAVMIRDDDVKGWKVARYDAIAIDKW